MNSWLNFIGLSVMSILGASGVSTVLIRWLLGNHTKRIEAKLAHDSQQLISRLEHELAKEREQNSFLLQLHGEASREYHAKLMEAVVVVWDATLQIRELCGRYTYPWLFLVPDEYDSVSSDKLKEWIYYDDEPSFDSRMQSIVRLAERQRPLVGERIWEAFQIISIFFARLALKGINSRKSGRLQDWRMDVFGKRPDDIEGLLGLILGRSEVKEHLVKDSLGGPRVLMLAAEAELLRRVSKELHGSEAVNRSIEELRVITEAMRSADHASLSSLQAGLRTTG